MSESIEKSLAKRVMIHLVIGWFFSFGVVYGCLIYFRLGMYKTTQFYWNLYRNDRYTNMFISKASLLGNAF